MRVIIFEDEIDGEVQDGSVDLEQELLEKLKEACRWLSYYARTSINNNAIADGAYTNPRIDAGLKEDTRMISLDIKVDLDPQKQDFVITKSGSFDFYKEIVRVLHDKYPEIFAYPMDLLSHWSVKIDPLEIYMKEAMIGIDSFMPSEFDNMHKAPCNLAFFLTNEDYMRNKLTLPYAPSFAENFRSEYLKTRKKLFFLINKVSTGTFKGRTYKVNTNDSSFSIYISKRTYSQEERVIHPVFQSSVAISGSEVVLDGEKYSLYRPTYSTYPSPNDVRIYFRDLNEYFREFFIPFKIECKILMDPPDKEEATPNSEQ